VRLSAIDIGDGPPAVLMHGQPGNAGDWWPVTIRLRERMRVIAPDRPGYGRTGGRPAGFRDNAEAMATLLEGLDVQSAVVAGHSWATGVALEVVDDAEHARFHRRGHDETVRPPVLQRELVPFPEVRDLLDGRGRQAHRMLLTVR
jgi:pimeloyl-ACP methyl ester carboxylesterase